MNNSTKFEGGSSKQQVTPLNFERLLVYQKAVDFVDDVYTLTRAWSRADTWDLKDQLRRAALSVALNIAEGSGRTKRDFRNFLRNARSSCYECLPLLEISRRQQHLSGARYAEYRIRCLELTKMISGLMKALSSEQPPRPSSNLALQTSNFTLRTSNLHDGPTHP